MGRAFTLTTLIFACYLVLSIDAGTTEAQRWRIARHRKPTKLTTKTPLPNKTTLIVPTATVTATDEQREYHPAVVQKPRLIERYDKRSLDGHYEYRYVLSNGDVRYERAYWMPVGHTKVLARKGYYSYPLPNHRFHTVFYTADHNGFHEEESSYTRTQPTLPRSLKVAIVSDVASGKPAIEKNKINRKPNRTAAMMTTTMSTILQKGRIAAISTETGKSTGIAIGMGTGTGTGTGGTKTTTTTATETTVEKSAAWTTKRPQINIEAAAAPIATEVRLPTDETQAVQVENETINSIKPENVQTTTGEAETEQLQAVAATTVLSMD